QHSATRAQHRWATAVPHETGPDGPGYWVAGPAGRDVRSQGAQSPGRSTEGNQGWGSPVACPWRCALTPARRAGQVVLLPPEPHTTRGAPWPQPRDAPRSVDGQLACSSSLSVAASAGWIRWGGYDVAVAAGPADGLAALRT